MKNITYGIIGIVGLVIIGVLIATLQSGQESNDKLRIAYFANIGHLVPIVGLEQGLFSEALSGVVNVDVYLFDSGPQAIESLFANSIDLAYVGPGPAINGYVKSDGKLRIITGSASGGTSLVGIDESIKGITDLDGKKVSSPQLGNTQDISLRHNLKENGLKGMRFGGTVTIHNVANPDTYTLFAKGDIDAAWVPEPWATILVKELNGTRVFREETLWSDERFASVVLVGKSEYIEKNEDIIKRWVQVHEEIVSWINENPLEAKEIFHSFMYKTYGKTIPDYIIDEAMNNLEITSELNKESIITFAQRADELGYLGRDGYSLEKIFWEGKLP